MKRFVWVLGIGMSPAWALEVEPLLYVDSIVYGDSVKGKGVAYTQEALGGYNTHSDEHDGHVHDGLETGGQMRSMEAGAHITLSNKWDATLRGTPSIENMAVEIEEAWSRYRPTTNTSVKAGKFISAFGQHNQHPHEWDFVQQNLPTQLLLDGGLIDNGLQMQWHPQNIQHVKVTTGIELLDGGNRGIAAKQNSDSTYQTGKGKLTQLTFSNSPSFPSIRHIYLKAEKPMGEHQHLQGGVSYLQSQHHQELHPYHAGINEADYGLTGNAKMLGMNVAYQRDAHNENGVGSFKVQAEYLRQDKNMAVTFHEEAPEQIGQTRDVKIDGYTLQGVYQFAPKWQAGIRHEQVGGLHEVRDSTTTNTFDTTKRNAVALTWQPAKQHQLRLETAQTDLTVADDLNRDGQDEAVNKKFNQVMLQYLWRLDTEHEHAHAD